MRHQRTTSDCLRNAVAAGSSPRRAGRNVDTATHWPFTEMVVNSLITNLYRCANVPALDRYLPRN